MVGSPNRNRADPEGAPNIAVMPPVPFDRGHTVAELEATAAGDRPPFDLIVVGAGITGAGVALDAAARGLRTALVDRGDHASGTSSKSSKMVHGGLRYLQNGETRLVYEALRERSRIMRNAPHLVEVLPFLIPIMTRDGVIKKKIARALGSAMWMYDLTGGWRIGRLHRRLSPERTAEHFPTCHTDELSAGYLYFDASTDDARLTLALAMTAAEHGAHVANHLPVTGLGRENGRVSDVTVDDAGRSVTVPTRRVVDATGVWSDDVRAYEEPTAAPQIRPAKGVHIALPWEKVRNDVAVVVPSKRDRRSVFLVPWGPNGDGTFRHTYVGTTDTDHGGGLDTPQCDAADVEYLLAALRAALTTSIDESDVTGVWAGLRPLVRQTGGDPSGTTADLSRRHVVDTGPGGVVHVNGGKLTTYRAMAEDAVDAVVDSLPDPPAAWRHHPTRRLRLVGAPSRKVPLPGGPHLARRYGTAARAVVALGRADPALDAPLVDGQPYLRAEVVHSVRSEMACHLDDVLMRRTRAHLFDRQATLAAVDDAADLMAAELGWSPDQREAEVDRYRQICSHEEEAVTQHATPTDTTD